MQTTRAIDLQIRSTEFQNSEALTIQTDSFLPKLDRAFGSELYTESKKQHERRGYRRTTKENAMSNALAESIDDRVYRNDLQVHHVKPRGQAGGDVTQNLITQC